MSGPMRDDDRSDRAVKVSRSAVLILAAGLVLAVVAGLVAAVSPGFRDEVSASVTRRDPGYVELFFTRAGATDACTPRSGKVSLSAVLVNHRPDAVALAPQFTVTSAGDEVARTERSRIDPGQRSVVSTSLKAPAGGRYLVTIAVPDLALSITRHCGGPAR